MRNRKVLAFLATLLVAFASFFPLSAQDDGVGDRGLGMDHYDFRGSRFNEKRLNYYENDPTYLTPEKEGLRISLPANKPLLPPAGFVWPNVIRGDFDVTLSYEILEAEPPNEVKPSELVIFVPFESEEPREFVAIARSLWGPTGNEFAAIHGDKDAAGKWSFNKKPFPAAASKGTLRLKRTGSTIVYLAAENQGDDFVELDRQPCGTGDVLWVRVSAENGGANTAYSVRVVDFKVKSSEPTILANEERDRVGNSWILLGVMMGIALGIWVAVWVRRGREKRAGSAEQANPGNRS